MGIQSIDKVDKPPELGHDFGHRIWAANLLHLKRNAVKNFVK